MMIYLFNDCGICTNPITEVIPAPGFDIRVNLAEISGAWGYGLSVAYNNKSHGTGGFGFGVSIRALKYKSMEAARNASISEVSKRLGITLNFQLNLF